MEWSQERVDILKRMWQQGASAREISQCLGGTTRNAVIGKAYRIGLSTPKEHPAEPKPDRIIHTSIMNLTDRMCRWPTGHPGQSDFGFCGKTVIAGRPYCGAHCARAYAPRSSTAA